MIWADILARVVRCSRRKMDRISKGIFAIGLALILQVQGEQELYGKQTLHDPEPVELLQQSIQIDPECVCAIVDYGMPATIAALKHHSTNLVRFCKTAGYIDLHLIIKSRLLRTLLDGTGQSKKVPHSS